ncbi:hypothetical protein RFI_20836, partial [Reticulomyxa filosa]
MDDAASECCKGAANCWNWLCLSLSAEPLTWNGWISIGQFLLIFVLSSVYLVWVIEVARSISSRLVFSTIKKTFFFFLLQYKLCNFFFLTKSHKKGVGRRRTIFEALLERKDRNDLGSGTNDVFLTDLMKSFRSIMEHYDQYAISIAFANGNVDTTLHQLNSTQLLVGGISRSTNDLLEYYAVDSNGERDTN